MSDTVIICSDPVLGLTVKPLLAEQARRSWVLARLAAPDLDLESWQAYLTGQAAGGSAGLRGHGGIMCIEGPRQVLYGIFEWRVNPQWRGTHRLSVSTVVLMSSLIANVTVPLMVEAFEALAEGLGCVEIAVLDGPRSAEPHGRALAYALREHGYQKLRHEFIKRA